MAEISVDEALRWRAEHQPNKLAFMFLKNGTEPGSELTYQVLDRQARAIAALLQARLEPGDRVMLSFPTGAEFIAAFYGCLYAGMIAVPAPPPDTVGLKRSLIRIQAIALDAQPRLVLTASVSETLSAAVLSCPWYATEQVDQQLADTWQAPPSRDNDLAYLQYTSGSTATPKGVMIRHRNLVRNMQEFQEAMGYGPDSAVATWMPNFHDYGLVGGIVRPVSGGAPCYFCSPTSFLRRPLFWLEIISRYRVTHSGAAAFAYDYCVRKIADRDLTGLDLSHWQVASIGAEPVRQQTLRAFSEKFAQVGFKTQSFYPSYGLAEFTLTATAHQWPGPTRSVSVTPAQSHGRSLVSCGHTYGESQLLIVDPDRRTRCAEDVPGEIWLAGPSVAAGYWNRPEETRETFQAVLANRGEGPFLRTGDIGFLQQGNLFITGRLKNMIIRHGENYYAEDIEWIARTSHPAFQHSVTAVFSVTRDAVEHVVVAQEVEQPATGSLDLDALFSAIRQGIAEHLSLPVFGIALVKRGSIPRTSSGKVQRHLCREAYLEGSLDSLATWTLADALATAQPEPRDALEAGLAGLWQELLGVPQVGSDVDFFSLGGDSLLALQLTVRVEQQFGRTVPPEFFQRPTLAHLTHLLRDEPITHQSPPNVAPLPRAALILALRARIAARIRRWTKQGQAQLRGQVKQLILQIPFPMRRSWLTRWFGLRLVRQHLCRKQILLTQRYLRCLGIPAEAEPATLRTVLMPSWGLGATDLFDIVSSQEALKGLQERCGVILLMYHDRYGNGTIRALSALGFDSVFVVRLHALSEMFQTLYPGGSEQEFKRLLPSLLATHLHAARACLLRRGVVIIYADGGVGTTATVHQPVHGRWYPFKTGFAELALRTGAAVVPVSASMGADGRVCVRLHPALDPGGESLPHVERVHYLIRQYATFFQDTLRNAPDTLPIKGIRDFLQLAPVTRF